METVVGRRTRREVVLIGRHWGWQIMDAAGSGILPTVLGYNIFSKGLAMDVTTTDEIQQRGEH